jgi:hypothetical protein
MSGVDVEIELSRGNRAAEWHSKSSHPVVVG